MQLVEMPVAGSGGQNVFINPEHVVCVFDAGRRRSQIVTTGLSSEASITILVELPMDVVAGQLQRASAARREVAPQPA